MDASDGNGFRFRNRWPEEEKSPVPRPRPMNSPQFSSFQTNDTTVGTEDVKFSPNLSPKGLGPASESILHTQRVAEGLFHVSSAGGGTVYDRYCSKIAPPEGRRADAFDVIARAFDFQASSVLNQRDNAASILASRLSRAVGQEVENMVSVTDAALVLKAFHGELLSNYIRWCGFLRTPPVSLAALFVSPGAPVSAEARKNGRAAEAALVLLIWGEAGNLRFCPEFLCFLFHKMGRAFKRLLEGGTSNDIEILPYLDGIITPAYDILAEQLSNLGHGVIDHSEVCNYDDFNEIFWQGACLKLELDTMFDDSNLNYRFRKTFVERQSWLVPVFAFWRVHMLHIMGLHVMIVGALCEQELVSCTTTQWGATVITLYACSFVRDMWDILQSWYVLLGNRRRILQFLLNILRAAMKALIIYVLVTAWWDEDDSFPTTAGLFFALAVGIEAIMITKLWWGFNLGGKCGSTQGGFGFVPGSLRHISWSVIGSLVGINSVNLYTQIHELPPLAKRLKYIGFWMIVLLNKILFSYFVVIKKMTRATDTLYRADESEYDFGFLGVYTDEHNYIYIVALWLGSGLIYFLDMQIWFVLWTNIAAAVEGVRRRVGEVKEDLQLVKSFSEGLHKPFFSYLKREMMSTTLHTRFAHIWNEIVDAMREEDIISNRERLQLRYFLVNLRQPKAGAAPPNEFFAPRAKEGEWGPLFTLLPEFLMSGSVQRAVQSSKEFSSRVADELSEIKREEGLIMADSSGSGMVRPSGVTVSERSARVSVLRTHLAIEQHEFLKAHSSDEVISEMVRQLAATAFILLDALCRSDELSRSVWNVYRALFASDVGEGGKDIANKEWWISSFYGNKDKPAVKVAAAFSKNTLLFSVQNFPAFVTSMIDLVKVLDKHVSTAGWNKEVDSKLSAMATALSALLQTKAETIHDNYAANLFLHLLKDVQRNLDAFVAAGAAAPEARRFKASAKSFLRRSLVFLEAPANSQAGVIKGGEASRRIKFFVDSLTVEQPKPTRVLKMPSFTTLTPYYNEDVVLSVESLREETQDGLRVLEYLRTIYPGEFDNFVERMRIRSKNNTRDFPFDVDVVGTMLGVALDTELGMDISRDGMLKRVERAIVAAVKTKRINDELEPVETQEIEAATRTINIDEMMLQLQLWASNRGQTLSRTVRGMMYYSQAVRLLAVVENIEEFQPEETGYMFGISDRPDNDAADSDDDNNTTTNNNSQGAPPGGGNSPRPNAEGGFGMNAFRNFLFGVTQQQQSGTDVEAMLDAQNAANLFGAAAEGNGGNVAGRASTIGGSPFRSEGDAEGADFKGFIQVKDPALDKTCDEYRLTRNLAEAKYRYVVSCQVFGKMQKAKDKTNLAKAGHIKMLARMYPGLRIAHVDEVDGSFYSVLSKHAGGDSDDMVEEYRVRLPGQILVGEGKPNNQNHAIIFTRGEAVQAIDMNQDATLEDAVKIRQVMEEFEFAQGGIGRGHNKGRIVGFREHVFTHDVSAVANFFSLQELNFVSATQRALDNPLHVRFHYGHPDLFDRVSAITLGGVSKSCKGIHLSEDIFAGFNYVLRGGYSTQADYIQVSKGRDTGVSQVTGFTAKISMGNGMQARSREVGRLASQFDMFRLLSFYYSSVGGFMNQVLLMTAVFLYVYAKLYIVFDPEFTDTVDDDVLDALSSQFLIQLGFLLILPIPLMLAVEKGLQFAVSKLFNILLRLAPFFFIFSAGTNAFYVNSAVMTGQAKYQATGRGFVIAHEEFVDMYRLYLTSHFNPAFELLLALTVYGVFATSGYFLETFSVYLLVIGMLWTPLLFNPNGLDFTYARQDFEGWLGFMSSPVNDPKKGWLSWYSHVCEEARQELPMNKKLQAVVRKTRLLILVYGFLSAIDEEYNGSWPGSSTVGLVMVVVVVLLVFESWIQSWLQSAFCPHKAHTPGWQQSRWARLWKLAIFVAVILLVIILATVDVLQSASQAVYYVLAFVILVYYVSQVVVLFMKDALRRVTLVRCAFRTVHYAIGIIIMLPVLVLSFLPIFVDLQTRMLFNDDFSQRFSIAKIFAKQSNRKNIKKNA